MAINRKVRDAIKKRIEAEVAAAKESGDLTLIEVAQGEAERWDFGKLKKARRKQKKAARHDYKPLRAIVPVGERLTLRAAKPVLQVNEIEEGAAMLTKKGEVVVVLDKNLEHTDYRGRQYFHVLNGEQVEECRSTELRPISCDEDS